MNTLLSSGTLILLFVIVFVIDACAELFNLQTSQKPLPGDIRDLQSASEKMRATEYLKDRVALGLAKDSFFLVIFIALMGLGFFDLLQTWTFHVTGSPVLEALLFGAVLIAGQGILSIPFSVYSTFNIEAKYGFNRTTRGTFVSDLLKGALVGAILLAILFTFFIKMLDVFADDAWLAIWIGYTAFQFFLVWIAPVTLLPLFLKLTPLPEGDLLKAIEAYSQKQSFQLNGVWVCDASKRSAKSNAFFTGFGRFRRLVLFDTLIEKHKPAEIVAVVAHEAGHFKLGHIWKTSVFSAFSSLLFFYVLQKLLKSDSLYFAFGVVRANVGIGLVLAVLVLSKVLFFASPLRAYFSRRNEYAADRFSAETTGDPASLVSGLKRLVTDNLATLQHHPLYVLLNDSHPPLHDRIKPLMRNTMILFFLLSTLSQFSFAEHNSGGALGGGGGLRPGQGSVFPPYKRNPMRSSKMPNRPLPTQVREDHFGNRVNEDHLNRVEFAHQRGENVMRASPQIANHVSYHSAAFAGTLHPIYERKRAAYMDNFNHYHDGIVAHPAIWNNWHAHYFYGGFYYGFHPVSDISIYFYNPLVHWFYVGTWDDAYYRTWYGPEYEAYPNLHHAFRYYGVYYPTENLKQLLFGVSAMPVDKQAEFQTGMVNFTQQITQGLANYTHQHVALSNGDIVVTHYETLGVGEGIDLEGTVNFQSRPYNFKGYIRMDSGSATQVFVTGNGETPPTDAQLKTLDELNQSMAQIRGEPTQPPNVAGDMPSYPAPSPTPASGEVSADPTQ